MGSPRSRRAGACVHRAAIILGAALALVGGASARAALIVGQKDNFQTTSGNWANGGGAADPFTTTGGPGGATDRFLQISSRGGTGAGSKMVTYNRTQWTGNFTSAKITGVEMDLKDFGTQPLTMR